MFYHVKELQFNARVTKPDPAFATLLLEQFGEANGELAAALRYFMQAFRAKNPHPDKYDMLMDIAIEEFSHLEIVGATIQMLLTGINGDLKDAAENSDIMKLLNGKAAKENMIHQGMIAPQFLVGSAGGPCYTNSQGVPWTAAYINGDGQGELTSDLRSDMDAETRAKMVYEYLLQYTSDPYVKETLRFLMMREVAHYQMFEAALATIQPNFPMGTLQTEPKFSNLYFNLSTGNDFRGPWNEGQSTQLNETFQYIDDPIKHVMDTNSLLDQKAAGTKRTEQQVQKINRELGKEKKEVVTSASPAGVQQWNETDEMDEKKSSSNNAREKKQNGKGKPKSRNQLINLEQADRVQIIYYTDPLCCWSWAMEPQLQKLRSEFSGQISWRYCMGGLLPGWKNYHDEINDVSRPIQMGPVWMHAQQVSGVAMNSTIWMRDPPASSYPSCIAVKCAFLQSPEAGEKYLMLLREALMLHGKNIAEKNVLIEIAGELSKEPFYNFDEIKFMKDMKNNTGLEAFRKDLQEIQYRNIKRFPTMIIKSSDNQGIVITGFRPYSMLLESLKQAAPYLHETNF